MKKNILFWFDNNKRSLPWRIQNSWYKTWISEVMLQQTQVAKVIPYFQRFIKTFPNLEVLAKSDLQDILLVWQGLGYYRRAHNLHKAAKTIADSYNNELPRSFEKVRQLPGFGDYITSAVLSIAFNMPFTAVDGNIIRVIARLFAVQSDIRSRKTKQRIKRIATVLLDKNRPGAFNEAIMELGATICVPVNPLCKNCPVRHVCKSFQNNITSKIPFKSSAPAKPTRYQISFIITKENNILIAQKKDEGLLSGLWEFPSLQSDENFSDLNIFKFDSMLEQIKHSYTHFNLIIQPVTISGSNINNLFKNDYQKLEWIEFKNISLYPVHTAMQKIISLLD